MANAGLDSNAFKVRSDRDHKEVSILSVNVFLKISFSGGETRKEGCLYEEEESYDALNDETFGDGGEGGYDWEAEHEKLTKELSVDASHGSSRLSLNNAQQNYNYRHFLSENDDEAGPDMDAIVKSISDLGIDDLDDPAIMTYGRGAKVPFSSPQPFHNSSPPPPAFLDYELSNASPKMASIWTFEQSEPKQSTNFNKIKTLQEIEQDMLHSNNECHLKTVKNLIKAEDLEATLLNSSSDNSNLRTYANAHKLDEWNSFSNSSLIPDIVSNVQVTSFKSALPEEQKWCASPFSQSVNVRTVEDLEKDLLAQSFKSEEREINSETDALRGAQPIQENPQDERQLKNEISLNDKRPNFQNFPFSNNVKNIRPPILNRSPYYRHPMMSMMRSSRPINFHPMMARPLYPPGFFPPPSMNIPPEYRGKIMPFKYPPVLHPLLPHHPNRAAHQSQAPFRGHFLKYRQSFDDEDEYSGLMTQRDKEWLIKIQQMQLESDNPYVDDYYNVTYLAKKIAAASTANKENIGNEPSLLLPERAPKVDSDYNSNTNYVPRQFEGSLGKIQVSNINCPRKLLDFESNKQVIYGSKIPSIGDLSSQELVKGASKSEVSKFRNLLLQIEKLYLILLNVDDENKRIGALPEAAQKLHIETRDNLCDQLFNGVTIEKTDKINLEMAQIRKGLALILRCIPFLTSQTQRAVIISEFLDVTNFKLFIIKSKYGFDNCERLIFAIKSINDSEILLDIACGIDSIASLAKSEVNLFNFLLMFLKTF